MERYSQVNPSEALDALDVLRWMRRVRAVDRRERSLIRQGKGWIHIPSEGHEAMAVVGLRMAPDDLFFGYYRDRPVFLARGMTPRQMGHDYFANAQSSSKGRAMPMHGTSKELGLFPPATPTGSQCLPATGAAWNFQMSGSKNVVVCTIGDASSRQGEFYEAVCFAVQEKLPIVFIVEDNGYGICTPTERHLPFRMGIFAEKLVQQVDGRRWDMLDMATDEALTKARLGGGPTVLWVEFDRLASHTNADDHRIYRDASELEQMTARDPLRTLSEELIATGRLDAAQWEREQAAIDAEVDQDYLAAEAIGLPDPAQVLTDVYADAPSRAEPVPLPVPAGTNTMVQAVNLTLRAALEADPRIVIMGEDVEDPKGGVFGLTKGLSRAFPKRVVNAPLAEATIVGVGAGMAATGMRPVFELQFIDFMAPAFNQLIAQISTLRWRSGGDWTCPLVMYAPYGAYLPAGGMWHSQSNDGIWAHLHGLRVAVPSTPADAAGLFWTAMREDEPTLILLPKHIFRKKLPAQAWEAVPFGKAQVRKEGGDVTVVAWGNTVELADEVAHEFQLRGVGVEVIDLRSLVPCDWETVERSVAKTGRLVVISEDSRTTSFGQAVVSELVSSPQRFGKLRAAPQLVARPDVNIPYAPILEAAILPSADAVARAIEDVLRQR